MPKLTYLDYNATSPVDPRVFEVLQHFCLVEYGNAGSRTHAYGTEAKKAVTRAREEVASVVDARPDEVVFTSGATESNNLAIQGLSDYGMRTGRKHLLTTAVEHKAVLEPMAHLESLGFEVDYLPVHPDGSVSVEVLQAHLRKDTLLVSVMHVNNETGIAQPIESICATLKDHSAFFHVDAAQSFGKILKPLKNKRIDFISASGHKIFAPKGVGALIARNRGYERAPLKPLFFGGGQERGLRPGTLPVALVASFGKALEIATKENKSRLLVLERLRTTISKSLIELGAKFNGDQTKAVPWTTNFYIPDLDSEALMLAAKEEAAISNGSACTSNSYTPSHVLVAMGIKSENIAQSIRLSWSHTTKIEELDGLFRIIRSQLSALT